MRLIPWLLAAVSLLGCTALHDVDELRARYPADADAGPEEVEVTLVITGDLTPGTDFDAFVVTLTGGDVETFAAADWPASADARATLTSASSVGATLSGSVELTSGGLSLTSRAFSFTVDSASHVQEIPFYAACVGESCDGACLDFESIGLRCVDATCFDETISETSSCAECVPLEAPSSSGLVDASSDASYVFALRDVDLTADSLARPWRSALELDGICSFVAAQQICSRDSGVVLDGPAGQDNAFLRLMDYFVNTANIYGDLIGEDAASAFPSQRYAAGERVTLVRISGLGDFVEDRVVEVEFYTGVWRSPLAPAWTGADEFDYDEDNTASAIGYVRDGRLYTLEPRAPFFFHLPLPVEGRPPAEIELANVLFEADLVLEDGALVGLEDAILAGRWDEGAADAEIRRTLCTDYDPILNAASEQVGNHRDIIRGDVSSMGACDALSFGLRFRAYPVQLGSEQPAIASEECSGILLEE